MKKDPDYEWLMTHLPDDKHSLRIRENLAKRVNAALTERIEKGQLPYTIGVFGGWGSGKTTFLALLAKELEQCGGCKIVYFNSWKYAGLMEIVPSLIYKILQYGVSDSEENQKKVMRVLLSLGKEYADKFGEWAERRVGVNFVELCKEVLKVKEIIDGACAPVPSEILKAYYTQVDRAQNVLLEILGGVTPGKKISDPIIVLVDELDRCDPDEAFNVIKQMRVLFAMRHLPVAFVMCANPDPIGLAIKHRYGLESGTGDYESRRILEKFVDAYEDFTEAAPLGELISSMWEYKTGIPDLPWIMEIDKLNTYEPFNENVIGNACVFDVFTTDIPYFSNLRVLQKTFTYLNNKECWNYNLLWSLWHLEIVKQLDPQFREALRSLAVNLRAITERSYYSIEDSVKYKTVEDALVFNCEKGNTLFSIFRSLFWDNAKDEEKMLMQATDQESRKRLRHLQEILADHGKMDFLISMCLLPFPKAPSYSVLTKNLEGEISGFRECLSAGLGGQLGYSIANQ